MKDLNIFGIGGLTGGMYVLEEHSWLDEEEETDKQLPASEELEEEETEENLLVA